MDTRVLTASVDAACPEADLVATWLSRIGTLKRGRYLGRMMVVPLFTLAATWRLGRRAPGRLVVSHGDTLAGDVCVIHAVNKASVAEKRQTGKRLWMLNPMHAWVGWRDRYMLGGLRFRRLVAVSERVREELVCFYGVPLSRITLIPNGVNVERFRPEAGDRTGVRQEFGIPAAARLLLFAGHEFERKGLSLIIDALALLPADVHLLVAGAGDAAAYQAQADRLGIGGRVAFAGSRPDLPRIYPAGDVFVFPTYYKSFALVCMEAMSSGLPLFATRVGGIEDYLEDGGNGYFIEREPSDIAAKLRPVLDDPARLRSLGAAARRTAERYAWHLIAGQYLDLLRSIESDTGEQHGTTGAHAITRALAT